MSLAATALQLAGTAMGASATGASNAQSYKQWKKKRNLILRQHEAMLGRAQGLADTGEQQFLGEYQAAPSELSAARQALLNRESESLAKASGQIGANLSRMGARGTQGLLAQNEAVGQIAQQGIQDIDLEAYQDALRRRSAKGQFFGSKAATGQAGLMTQANLSGL